MSKLRYIAPDRRDFTDYDPNRYLKSKQKGGGVSVVDPVSPPPPPVLPFSSEFLYTGRITSGSVSTAGKIQKVQFLTNGEVSNTPIWSTDIELPGSGVIMCRVSAYYNRLFYSAYKYSFFGTGNTAKIGEINPETGSIISEVILAESASEIGTSSHHMEISSDGKMWVNINQELRKYDVNDLENFEIRYIENDPIRKIGTSWVVVPGFIFFSFKDHLTKFEMGSSLPTIYPYDNFGQTSTFGCDPVDQLIFRSTAGSNTRVRAYDYEKNRQWERTPGSDALRAVEDKLITCEGGTQGYVRVLDKNTSSLLGSWESVSNQSVGSAATDMVFPNYKDFPNSVITFHNRTGGVVLGNYNTYTRIGVTGIIDSGSGTVPPLDRYKVHT